jgi:hypothetical protein
VRTLDFNKTHSPAEAISIGGLSTRQGQPPDTPVREELLLDDAPPASPHEAEAEEQHQGNDPSATEGPAVGGPGQKGKSRRELLSEFRRKKRLSGPTRRALRPIKGKQAPDFRRKAEAKKPPTPAWTTGPKAKENEPPQAANLPPSDAATELVKSKGGMSAWQISPPKHRANNPEPPAAEGAPPQPQPQPQPPKAKMFFMEFSPPPNNKNRRGRPKVRPSLPASPSYLIPASQSV